MQPIQIVATIVDEENNQALERHRLFKRTFSRLGGHVLSISEAFAGAPPDCIAVFGGDGTMLKAIQAHWQAKVPFLGVACGAIGALGNEPKTLAGKNLFEGVYETVSFPLVRFLATTVGGEKVQGIGVNDATLQRREMLPGACHLRVSVDGKVLDHCLRGDGLIVATPLGSTAYSLHAGGPAIDFTQNLLVTTGIVAERSFASVVHNEKAKISVDVLRPKEGALLVADNVVQEGIHEATFWLDPGALRLIFLEPQSFVEHLHRIARKRNALLAKSS